MLQRMKIIRYSSSKFFRRQVNVSQQGLYFMRLPKVLRHLPISASWASSVHSFTKATFFTCTCSFSYPSFSLLSSLYLFPLPLFLLSQCLGCCQNDITVKIQWSRLTSSLSILLSTFPYLFPFLLLYCLQSTDLRL